MKKILFLGCNHDQLPYLRELKNYPYKIIGTDMNFNAPGRNLCDEFHQIAYDDIEEIVKIGKRNKFNSEDKVFTASAQFSHKGAANFASVFGIKYPSEETIDLCLDKTLFYKRFEELGIPIPDTILIENKKMFEELLPSLDVSTRYYLKSDFSKNPNYVYNFTRKNIVLENIFWGHLKKIQGVINLH